MSITYHFDLYPRDDPRDGTRLVRFTKLQSAEYRGEANGTGSGRFTLRGDTTDAGFIDPAGLQYVRVVRDDGATEVVVGGFFLDNGDFTALDERGTRLLTFGGAGTLSYLDREIMWSHTYVGAAGALSALGGGQDPFDDLWRLYAQGSFAGGDHVGSAMWRALAEALSYQAGAYTHKHADGTLHTDTHPNDRTGISIPALTLGFDGLTDSDGTTWTVASGEFGVQVGTTLLAVIKRAMEAGLYIEMDPDTFELNAWEADNHGRDRSGAAWGTDVIRFQSPTGGDITTGNVKSDAKRAIAAMVKRSLILAGGGDLYGLGGIDTDVPWHGFYPSDIADEDALFSLAGAQLAARDDASDTIRLRIIQGDNPTNGKYVPFEHILLDDRVTVHTGTGQWDWNEDTFPVAAITLSLRQGGDWDCWVDLGSSYTSMAERAFQARGVPTHSHPPNPMLCDPTIPAVAISDPDAVIGWDHGVGGTTDDASAIIDGDVLSGDGTGYFIARNRGADGGVWMYWSTPVEITSYTMRQGFSPEDAQFASSGLVRAGWRVYVSDDVLTSGDTPNSVSLTEVENAEASAGLNDSVHPLSAGAHRWWYWKSTVQDTPGVLQIDWIIREIELEGGTAAQNPLAGTSGKAARCDHNHYLEELKTTETDTALVPHPDGDGGVEWGADSGGAPVDATYLTTTANGTLTNEVVVGTSPGGELGGTWASPTVDSVHSGSAHLALGTTAGTAAEGDHTHTGSDPAADTAAWMPLTTRVGGVLTLVADGDDGGLIPTLVSLE